ncbi:hypothetical protein Tco_1304828 [Tanacetum coccineum]
MCDWILSGIRLLVGLDLQALLGLDLVLNKVVEMISCTNESKPLALSWGRTLRLDSGVRVRKHVVRGSSSLTQTGMVEFVSGRAVTEAAQRKRVKYKAKCADIGYGFLPFSFSSFGELEKDAVTLLKRIRKFSMDQDIGARAAVHIFNRISFSIAKGVGAQIVSRLPSNLL